MPRGRAEAILPGCIGNIALVARRASALLTTRRDRSWRDRSWRDENARTTGSPPVAQAMNERVL